MNFDIKSVMANIPVGSYIVLRVVEIEEKDENGEVVKTRRAVNLGSKGFSTTQQRATAAGYILANTALKMGKEHPDRDFETMLSDLVAEFWNAIESADANVSTGTIHRVEGEIIGESAEEIVEGVKVDPANAIEAYE